MLKIHKKLTAINTLANTIKSKIWYVVLGLFCIPLLAFITNDTLIDKIIKRLDFLLYNFPHEKVFVNTDKPHYILGDTIWFSVKAIDATFYDKNSVSSLVYVQLVDEHDNIKTKLKVPILNKNGRGYMALDYELIPGSYSIQAYTSYMLNYDLKYIFSKEIMIWASQMNQNTITLGAEKKISTGINTRFFPEGGRLVENIETVVAFEVLDNSGLPIDISMVIKDSDGKSIIQAKTVHDGMGMFTLIPAAGKQYFAMVGDQKIDLPPVEKLGYGLRVINRNIDDFSAIIKTNRPEGLQGAFLVCHVRGEVFYTQNNLEGNAVTIKIDKKDLTSGVAQITVFDRQGVPVAERTFFVNNINEIPQVKIEMPYAYQNTRSKTDISCTVADQSGTPLETEYSVSVFDAEEVHYSPNDLDIRSYFLLNSDLTKTLRSPGYYFKENTSKNTMLLDLAMMVHGWTRIKSETLVSEEDPILKFGPERGLTLSGTVFKDGKPAKNIRVDVSMVDGLGYIDQSNTNSKGRFAFYDVPAFKGQVVYLRAFEEIKKGKKIETSDKVEIEMDQLKDYQVLANVNHKIQWEKDFNPTEFLESSLEKNRNDSLYAAMSVQLDQVTIKVSREKRDQTIAKERGIIYPRYDSRVFLDSTKFFNPAWTIFDFVVNTTPGAQLVGRERGDPSIRFRGGLNSFGTPRPAVFYLDGMPISTSTAANVDINNVEFIDVLRSLTATTIYGNDGMGGIVHIYSKLKPAQSQKRENKKNVAKYIAEGFHEARDFYSPDYSKTKGSMGKPDIRTTLYWAPLIKTNMEGKSNFTFYTSDKTSKYIVNVQGMTNDGRPFTGYSVFEVKKNF